MRLTRPELGPGGGVWCSSVQWRRGVAESSEGFGEAAGRCRCGRCTEARHRGHDPGREVIPVIITADAPAWLRRSAPGRTCASGGSTKVTAASGAAKWSHRFCPTRRRHGRGYGRCAASSPATAAHRADRLAHQCPRVPRRRHPPPSAGSTATSANQLHHLAAPRPPRRLCALPDPSRCHRRGRSPLLTRAGTTRSLRYAPAGPSAISPSAGFEADEPRFGSQGAGACRVGKRFAVKRVSALGDDRHGVESPPLTFSLSHRRGKVRGRRDA